MSGSLLRNQPLGGGSSVSRERADLRLVLYAVRLRPGTDVHTSWSYRPDRFGDVVRIETARKHDRVPLGDARDKVPISAGSGPAVRALSVSFDNDPLCRTRSRQPGVYFADRVVQRRRGGEPKRLDHRHVDFGKNRNGLVTGKLDHIQRGR